jgi:hypothetical protein
LDCSPRDRQEKEEPIVEYHQITRPCSEFQTE